MEIEQKYFEEIVCEKLEEREKELFALLKHYPQGLTKHEICVCLPKYFKENHKETAHDICFDIWKSCELINANKETDGIIVKKDNGNLIRLGNEEEIDLAMKTLHDKAMKLLVREKILKDKKNLHAKEIGDDKSQKVMKTIQEKPAEQYQVNLFGIPLKVGNNG